MKYLMLSRTEDEVHIQSLSKEKLNKTLEDYKEGYEFLKSTPDSLEEFPSWSVFIMKGDIVTPKAVEKVVTLEID